MEEEQWFAKMASRVRSCAELPKWPSDKLGRAGICQYLYDHPEGLDPPFEHILYQHIPQCKKFSSIVAKAGDVFITHGLLPHTNGQNHLHYARVIANPHVNMIEPFNLNREDGDYVCPVPSTTHLYTPTQSQLTKTQTLCEQVILRALNRTSIPEYQPTRPHLTHYPRTAGFKRARIAEELERMMKAAEAQGLSRDSVDSVYLKGEAAIAEHERRNGYDKAAGPNGIIEATPVYWQKV